MKNVLIGLVIGLSAVCLAMARYPVGQSVPAEIYTAAMVVDPNDDLIYQQMPLTPKQWKRAFGDNERTRLFFTIDRLIRNATELNARVDALEGIQKFYYDPISEEYVEIDPNIVVPNEAK